MLKHWFFNNIQNKEWYYVHILPIVEWCQRVYYCHHNARVLEDFEYRMSVVLDCATGVLSKPYYEVGVMTQAIGDRLRKEYEQGYEDCKSDYDIKDEEIIIPSVLLCAHRTLTKEEIQNRLENFDNIV